MNKTSRTDEPLEGDNGYNQSPNPLSNDLTTNEDFNGIANSRALGEQDSQLLQGTTLAALQDTGARNTTSKNDSGITHQLAYGSIDHGQPPEGVLQVPAIAQPPPHSPTSAGGDGDADHLTPFQRLKKNVLTFCSFIGPGFMISVAYSMSSLLSLRSRCSVH